MPDFDLSQATDRHRQSLRFAGPEALGDTTTVHYCCTTPEGIRAMKDCGMKGLLGLFGTEEEKRTHPKRAYGTGRSGPAGGCGDL